MGSQQGKPRNQSQGTNLNVMILERSTHEQPAILRHGQITVRDME